MPPDSDRNLPREIGGYQIIGILGEGGMSVVYTAMQVHPKRKVAISDDESVVCWTVLGDVYVLD